MNLPFKLELPPGSSGTLTSHSRVIAAVRSPLGFFVLALLIVESFLIGAGTLFGLPIPYRVGALVTGVVLFLIVLGLVYRLVVKHPRNLVFSEGSHLAHLSMRYYGDNNAALSRADVEELPAIAAPEKPLDQLPAAGEAAKE